MKKRVLFSASLFHYVNDSASVIIPMIFPLLYNQQFLIKNYSHIGILSNLGLLATFVFQFIIANSANKFEYKHMLLFSVCGISLFLVLITLSWTFVSLLFFYLILRVFVSFYHPIGISMVSKTHPDRGLDFAMGIQSGSGNLGVCVAFISAGYIAQIYGWKIPLSVWALVCFCVGFFSFLSVRRISTHNGEEKKPELSSWRNALSDIKKYTLGFVFGGACWGTTVYFAPSLLNHRFQVQLGSTGVYLASWIGIGTITTYFFGYLSNRFGRGKIVQAGFIGSSFFLILLGIAPVMELAVASLLLFGAFLFLMYPAFQSFVGNNVPIKNQVLAFSIVANVQMLSGSFVVLVSGFVSDRLGINAPFLLLGVVGIFISVFYLAKQPGLKQKN